MNNRWLILLLFCACAFPIFAQETTAWNELNQTAKKHLINLVGIDTSASHPDEIAAARYIYKQLNEQKIDWDIFIPRKGRANLMARIKGTDPQQKPLLLISHLDTANAQQGWTFPPFKATLKDGNIYGLGTTDAKNYTAVYLTLFTWLAKQEQKPVRDIIFLATSGEETGSEPGLLWLGNTHWDKIKPGYALNEGGGIIKDTNGTDIVFAEAATKLYMDIKITALGNEGHTSIPQENNAVYNLSQALSKLENFNPPARVTAPARTLLTAILPLQDEDGKTTIQMLLFDENPKNRQTAAELMAQDPFFKTQLKDIITPTQISSPTDPGSTSASASAILNVRLLPDTDPDAFFAQLQALFEDDDHIVLEVLERPQTPTPTAMDGTDPLFASIKVTAQKLAPGAITVPGLSPASGDNEFLRKLGVITYGLGPDMAIVEGNTAHAADEHIREQDFYHQLEFVAGVVFDFAYGQDLLPLTSQNTTTPTK
ncbi:MAG: M20/M25/M40 family metallo-hydrolase [Elusimicrobiaceae bacterium]|nr:M20/M25/M40 family metallo-hydrolase [Elusimicrobiaceae bacterium]